MKTIRSSKHKICTIEHNKKSMVPHNDKRYLMNDSINNLPYGHYKIGFLNWRDNTDNRNSDEWNDFIS